MNATQTLLNTYLGRTSSKSLTRRSVSNAPSISGESRNLTLPITMAYIKLQNHRFVPIDGTAITQGSTATCLFQEDDISLTVMALCLIFYRSNQPMRLNNQQRTGLANLLGDMAVAIILGLMLAIFMGGVVAWWTATGMCIFSLIFTVASVYLRSSTGTKNGD